MNIEWYQLILLGVGGCMLGSVATFIAWCLCAAAGREIPRPDGADKEKMP